MSRSKPRYATLSASEKQFESILSDRVNKRTGAREFKIRWKGLSPAHDTWEPETNLQMSQVSKYDQTKLDTPQRLVGMLHKTYVIESHHGTRSTTGSKKSKTTERIAEFFVRSPEGQLYSALPKQVPPSHQLDEYMSRRVYAAVPKLQSLPMESKTFGKEALDLSAEESTPNQIRSQWRSGDDIIHHRLFYDGERMELVQENGPTQKGARDNILRDELESMATHREQAYARFLRFKKRQGVLNRYTIRKEFEDHMSAMPAIIPAVIPIEAIVLRSKPREIVVIDD